eukprot:338381-Pyramimonas_sp.AAC.1
MLAPWTGQWSSARETMARLISARKASRGEQATSGAAPSRCRGAAGGPVGFRGAMLMPRGLLRA